MHQTPRISAMHMVVFPQALPRHSGQEETAQSAAPSSYNSIRVGESRIVMHKSAPEERVLTIDGSLALPEA